MKNGLNNDEIDDRFFVHGRMEILEVLNDLILRQEPVTVSFGGGKASFVTTLLEARNKALTFELAEDDDTNSRLLGSRACAFVTHPDGILVKFSSGQARRLSWGGTDAFCVRLPQKVARLQRQESFRILIPAARAPLVKLVSADGGILGEWPLHDLSIGGLGTSLIGQPQLELGESIARVQTVLPGHGEINCAATLRHLTSVTNDGNTSRYRIGLTFTALPPEMRVAIQRYITQIEHERRIAAKEEDPNDDD